MHIYLLTLRWNLTYQTGSVIYTQTRIYKCDKVMDFYHYG